jgi:hypothetical protein
MRFLRLLIAISLLDAPDPAMAGQILQKEEPQPTYCEGPTPSYRVVLPELGKTLQRGQVIEFAIAARAAPSGASSTNGFQLLQISERDGTTKDLELHQIFPDTNGSKKSLDAILISAPVVFSSAGPLTLRVEYALSDSGPCGTKQIQDVGNDLVQ